MIVSAFVATAHGLVYIIVPLLRWSIRQSPITTLKLSIILPSSRLEEFMGDICWYGPVI